MYAINSLINWSSDKILKANEKNHNQGKIKELFQTETKVIWLRTVCRSPYIVQS